MSSQDSARKVETIYFAGAPYMKALEIVRYAENLRTAATGAR